MVVLWVARGRSRPTPPGVSAEPLRAEAKPDLATLDAEFEAMALRRKKEIEAATLADAEDRARKTLLAAMERRLPQTVAEATVSVVTLASEDLKGRIIGRDGRNKKVFEQTTGVDLIVDDAPDSVTLSSFDPVRREVARLALLDLLKDGKIHPTRIEEAHAAALAAMEASCQQAADRAMVEAKVSGLAKPVRVALGQLAYRTSVGQNLLDHSIETAVLAGAVAAEIGGDEAVARRAGLLHDIGKGLDSEWEGPHALAGMRFLQRHGEAEAVLHAVGAHHRDIEPATAEALAVIVGDGLSAARPGARREPLQAHVDRLRDLEDFVRTFEGVEQVYAVQGGREVRVIVRPQDVDDLGAARLANAIARGIEASLEYPGQIAVTVVREWRVQEVAQ